MPKDVAPDSADDALFVGQSMPWIDPMKEAMAWHSLVSDGFASEVEVMRKRGANPRDVIEQIAAHRKLCQETGAGVQLRLHERGQRCPRRRPCRPRISPLPEPTSVSFAAFGRFFFA
jgi:hypothetical protein